MFGESFETSVARGYAARSENTNSHKPKSVLNCLDIKKYLVLVNQQPSCTQPVFYERCLANQKVWPVPGPSHEVANASLNLSSLVPLLRQSHLHQMDPPAEPHHQPLQGDSSYCQQSLQSRISLPPAAANQILRSMRGKRNRLLLSKLPAGVLAGHSR